IGHVIHPKSGGGFSFSTAPVEIWALARRSEIQVSGEFEILSPPPYRSARLNAQRGTFTRLTHPVHVDVESYLVSRGVGTSLEKFEISAQAVGQALHDLELMGITFATMFPDIDGIARQANMGSLWKTIGQTGRRKN
ncbi:MAG: hypothetical protein AAGD14_18850, partial [Planctomycetota bacterium]